MAQLYLCEKPSQARDIARVLGASKQSDGLLTGSGVAVTWAIGHLLEMSPPDAYDAKLKQWRLDDLPILPTSWLMQSKPKSAKQLRIVERAIAQASEVIIATDADREGETIAREILDRCGWQGPIRRLWLSALDDASIRKALASLLPGEKTAGLYDAGLARSRADWLVGMNLTRVFTILGRNAGHESLLSVGRVQTPALRLVVDRDREIASFTPVPFWEIWADCNVTAGPFRAKWVPPEDNCDNEGRCINQQAARTLAQQLAGQTAVVRGVETRQVAEKAPLPFDLGTLQQEASRRWGMGVQQVLDVAQSLYEQHKATTYPRTDCPYLPSSMRGEADAVLAALVQSDASLEAIVGSADRSITSRCWNDKKITAHHAIIPTTTACDRSRMSEAELQIYGAIRSRYLAQFYPAFEYDSTIAQLVIGDEAFAAKGRHVTQVGWRVLFGGALAEGEKPEQHGAKDQQPLPPLAVGQSCAVTGLAVKDCQTTPPAHFTEGTLIAAMKNAAKWVTDPRLKAMLKETAGLGTEATRAGIIGTLLDRAFVMKRKRSLRATPTGCALVDALPAPVKDPAMTALWEQALDDIAHRNGDAEEFLRRQAEWVRQLVATACASGTIAASQAASHKCPSCEKPMRRRKASKGHFWACSGYPECKTTLDDNGGKPVPRAAPQPLARCSCGGSIEESAKAWSCGQCQAIVWKEMAGKRLDPRAAQALFDGKTVELSGLKSRKGKNFRASASLKDGKVALDFGTPRAAG